MKKVCLYCNSVLHGRSDKKFCDAYCKNLYHRTNMSKEEELIKHINSVLRRNRALLKFFSPYGRTTLKQYLLEEKGFNFKYFTHIFKSPNNLTYYLCYDYGYAFLENQRVLIILLSNISMDSDA